MAWRNFLRLFAATALLAGACLGAAESKPAADDFATRYAAARAAFEKEDYTRTQYLAESLLKDSLAQGKISPQLFQLLGHTRFRQGDIGRAALWYFRARMFPPPTPELTQNLSHIRGRTGNLAFKSNSFGDQYTAWLSRSDWMRLVVISSWVVLVSLFLFVFYTKSPGLRTLLMTTTVVGCIAGGLAFVGWYLHPTYEQVKDIAIVTAPNTQSYTAATTTAKAGKVIALPLGSQVRKLEERGLWSYVEVWREDKTIKEGGGEILRGWVQNDALSTFWPFDAAFLE